MSPSERPKANNKKVLQPYSDAMKQLLKKGSYNSGKRPSEHDIGETSFLTDHGGSISPSVLTVANTKASDDYKIFCEENEHTLHPARMPAEIPEFFIKFLTDENDLVLDPFSGSNTTGYVAESLNRYWLGIEAKQEYIDGSRGRFQEHDIRAYG